MSPTPPKRWKDRDEFTMDETLKAVGAHQRGELPPKFETDEYKAYRNEVLEAGGLEPDRDAAEVAIEELDTEGHFQRMSRGR